MGELLRMTLGEDRWQLVERMQAAMSLVEGHAEHTMDVIGGEVLPTLERLRAAMNRRRESRGMPWRVLERLLGLELKMRQYETGRRFCDAVVAAGGPAALARAWRGPQMLPTPQELEQPLRTGSSAPAVGDPARGRKQRPNACSSCHKLTLVAAAWLQRFHALVVCGCNDLWQAGYKHVFGRGGQTARPNVENLNDPPLTALRDEKELQMPTVSNPSSKTSKPRAKAARKVSSTTRKATARKTTARKTSRKVSARKSPSAKAASRGSLNAKASTAKGARTNALHQLESAVRQSETATRETAGLLGDYAERAVLIPVGAALLARDRVVSTVSDTLSTYSSGPKTQAQLRRFERRGVTARNRLEREVRKARVRVERQLRTRRRVVESRVNHLEDRRETFAKNGSDLAGRVPELAKEVQERILSLV